MPNGYDYTKEYGPHKYADHDGTSDCEYGCGCCMGPTMSHGPTGLDPFGICPHNPVDGKRVGGQTDYHIVVEQRIKSLSSRLTTAELKLKAVEPEKLVLAEEIRMLTERIADKEHLIRNVKNLLSDR